MKTNNLIFWGLIAVAGYLYAKDNPDLANTLKSLLNSTEETPAVAELPAPATGSDDETFGKRITTLLAGNPEQAKACCQLWWGMADVLLGDEDPLDSKDPLITTTKEVRDANLMAGQLTFGGRQSPSSEVLGAVDTRLREVLGGTPNVPLTDSMRKEIQQVFRAAAWGASQAK